MIFRFAISVLAGLAVTASTASAQVALQRKFVEGTQFVTRASNTIKQTLNISGMNVDTQIQNTITMRMSVGKRDPVGLLPVAIEIKEMQTNLSLPGGINLQFDSNNPGIKSPNPALEFVLEMFRAMVGGTITYQLNDKNQVAFVQGTDEILGRTTGMATQFLKMELDPDKLTKAFQQETDKYPEKPVTAGQTWQRMQVVNIGSGQSMTFQVEYKYQGTLTRDGKTLDDIGVTYKTVSYAVEPNAPSPVKVVESNLKVESGQGTIVLDRQRGAEVKSAHKIHIKGTMKLSVNNMDLAATLDLTFESDESLQE